ncbi:O-antigen ligase family protein [Enterococcus casseliflavus]|uniref:O-antigen ligase family protein n=1 Tax=Enterococcus casseliflavus TaxID=37734 RepID=UPI001BCFF1DF|nr:O-antigen ligase family protein [Enterococcus casseliflavus]
MEIKKLFLPSIIFVFLPLVYAISPYLFLCLVILCFLLCIPINVDIDTKIFCIYLISFSFFGISLFSFKIYDLVFIIGCLFNFKKFKEGSFNRRLVFLSCVFISIIAVSILLNLGNNPFSHMNLELFRYILSIITLIYYSNVNLAKKAIVKFLKLFSVLLSVQTIIMFYIMQRGVIKNFYSPLFQVTLFSEDGETRLAGFFSDPNKFMCFFFFLIIFFFIFKDIWKKNDFLFLIIMLVGSLLSFSRTAILSICIFIVLIIFNLIFQEQKYLRILLFFFVGLLVGIIVFLSPSSILNSLDNIFSWMLQILGRDRTAEINTTLSDDNRIFIWKLAIPLISENPLFGHGPISYSYLLPYPTHNTFLNLLLDYGVSGTVAYLLLMRGLFHKIPSFLSISFIMIPMLLLDMGNFRLIFVLLGLVYSINLSKGDSSIERFGYLN